MRQLQQQICDNYNNAIQKAKSVDEELTAIVRCTQHLAQLHAFSDGNTRTAYILLNRLLHEEGLPLCLFVNPNRLDGFSTQQLVELVKRGQDYFISLAKGSVPVFDDKYMPEKILSVDTAAINTTSNELLNTFVSIMEISAALNEVNTSTQSTSAQKEVAVAPMLTFAAPNLGNNVVRPRQEDIPTVELAANIPPAPPLPTAPSYKSLRRI